MNWVLGRIPAADRDIFLKMVPAAIEVVRLFAAGDMEAATREANGFRIG